ncbi:MAG: ferritin family protein [Nitrososphaerales archaeon]
MMILEERYASNLSSSVEGLKNVVVKETLRGIAHDSRKHANLYNAILSLLKGEGQLIVEQEYNQIKSILEEHIKVEMRMVNEVKNLLEVERDSRVKHLITEIYEDEVKHHAFMRRLLEAVIRHEAILEEDVWDAIWKDVLGHGAPLG